MNRVLTTVFMILVMAFGIASCKKGEGQGGTSSITGKVYGRFYNKEFDNFFGESACPDEDVYIIYGDDLTYSDDQKTNYDGTYEFKYLRKGHYKIFVYTKDSTSNLVAYPSGLLTISMEADITDKKQTIVLPNVKVIK